jgi:hypothetical protein
MNLHSEFDDLQIQRLNEFLLVANRIRKARRSARQGLEKFKKPNPSGGGARFSTPTSNKNPLFTKGSSAPPTQGSHKASSALSIPPPISPPSKEVACAIQALESSAALRTPTECQFSGKNAQTVSAKSDGGKREGPPQRSPSTLIHQGIPTRVSTRAIEAPSESSLTQVLTKHPPLLPRISESFSEIVGQRPDPGCLSVAATRQVTREDASAARAKDSSGKNEARRKPIITPTTAPPNPSLIAHSGSGPGSTSPTKGGHPRSITGGFQFGAWKRSSQRTWCSRCKATLPKKLAKW